MGYLSLNIIFLYNLLNQKSYLAIKGSWSAISLQFFNSKLLLLFNQKLYLFLQILHKGCLCIVSITCYDSMLFFSENHDVLQVEEALIINDYRHKDSIFILITIQEKMFFDMKCSEYVTVALKFIFESSSSWMVVNLKELSYVLSSMIQTRQCEIRS